MVSWIVILAVVLGGIVLGLAATKPDRFTVSRRLEIAAPADRIFRLIDDFREWPKWSPWEALDPQLARSHSGAEAGVGAVYSWKGNKKVGEGRMEIVASDPPRRIDIKLDFVKPFEAHNAVLLELTPTAGGTRVDWSMSGQSPFMFKLMGLFTSMDRMIGQDFERGLARLKSASEATG